MKIAVTVLLTLAAFGAGLFGMRTYLVQEPDAADVAADLVAPEDTLMADEALENATGLPIDSLVAIQLPDAPIGELERLRAQIALTQEQLPALLARLDSLETAVVARQDRYERAREIAASLGTLEDDDLRDLLVHLNGRVLTDIYIHATPRNRTKMLRALPAQVAGALVEHIAEGPGRQRTAARTAARDTTSTSAG